MSEHSTPSGPTLHLSPWVARTLIVAGLLLVLGLLLNELQALMVPVGIAFVIAYFLDPLIDRFETYGFNRSVAILLLLLVMLVVLTLVLFFLVPVISEQIQSLIRRMPRYAERLREWLVPTLEGWFSAGSLPRTGQQVLDEVIAQLQGVGANGLKPVSAVLSSMFSGTVSILLSLANLVLVPLFAFYFLRDFDHIVGWVRKLIPERHRPAVDKRFREMDEVLSAFLRGQLTVCLVLGSLYALGLTIVGIPLSILIGLTVGLFALIPYLGAVVGFVSAMAVVLLEFHGWGQVIGVLVVFGVVQSLDGLFITPRILGEKVGMSPVIVIIALMAGGQLFGLAGVLLAVPTAAVLKVLGQAAVEHWLQSRTYQRNRLDQPPPIEDEAVAPDSPAPADEASGNHGA